MITSFTSAKSYIQMQTYIMHVKSADHALFMLIEIS